jgi:hypothetical protein
MNDSAVLAYGAVHVREEQDTWGLFFLLASVTLCILMCLVSWVVCANIRSPTGDIVRDAVLNVLRPQERMRRRAVVAEVELAESPESFENSEDEAVLQRDDDRSNGLPSSRVAVPPPVPEPSPPPPSAKALGKRRAVSFATPLAEESTFLGPTVYGC